MIINFVYSYVLYTHGHTAHMYFDNKLYKLSINRSQVRFLEWCHIRIQDRDPM